MGNTTSFRPNSIEVQYGALCPVSSWPYGRWLGTDDPTPGIQLLYLSAVMRIIRMSTKLVTTCKYSVLGLLILYYSKIYNNNISSSRVCDHTKLSLLVRWVEEQKYPLISLNYKWHCVQRLHGLKLNLCRCLLGQDHGLPFTQMAWPSSGVWVPCLPLHRVNDLGKNERNFLPPTPPTPQPEGQLSLLLVKTSIFCCPREFSATP